MQPFPVTGAPGLIVLPPLPVYSLLCNADVDRALLCFDTLYRRCRDQFQLTVLDDGSLSGPDRERLLTKFGEIKLLSQAEREDLVAPRLRGKPNCLRYRKEHFFSVKLLDGPLLGTGAFALCDGDIYFVRDFNGIDRRMVDSDDLVFMRDWCTGFSISFSKRVLRRQRTRLPERFNAGLLYVGPRTYDLDFIEWFLGDRDFRGSGSAADLFLLEQTAWAALAGRVRSSYFDPEQVAFPTKDKVFPSRLVALHFARALRQLLDNPSFMSAVEGSPKAQAGEEASLQSRPAVFDGVIKGAVRRLYRKLLSGADVSPWADLSSSP
jgi:hypothetical protein